MSSAEALLARYLSQRRELGECELILESELQLVGRGTLQPPIAPSATSPQRAAASSPAERPVASPARTEVSPPRSTVIAAPPQVVIAPSIEVPGSLPVTHPLSILGTTASTCTACGLAKSRTTVVFGEGNPTADLVVVGEAPGADEDRSGRPFVGRAGILLNKLLLSVGFPRESVYICNVLKCRPPGNRNPAPEEVSACSGYLRGQLAAIRPRAILAVGTFPAQSLLQSTESIGKLRGTVHSYEGIPLIPTYHPAALLRNPGWVRPVWEDLQRLRSILDDTSGAAPFSNHES